MSKDYKKLNLPEECIQGFFNNENKRISDFISSVYGMFDTTPLNELNNLMENSFRKLTSGLNFLSDSFMSDFKKQLTDEVNDKLEDKVVEKKVEKKEDKGICSLVNKAINKIEKEENHKFNRLNAVDKFCAKLVKLINKDQDWSYEEKAVAIIAIKINLFSGIFFGAARARDFFHNVLTIDPNFKQVIGRDRGTKIKEIYSQAFKDLIKSKVYDGSVDLENAIYPSSLYSTSAGNRVGSDGVCSSKVCLTGEGFLLNIVNKKDDSPRNGCYVELVKAEGRNYNINFDSVSNHKIFNITPSTKLIDMVRFVVEDNNNYESVSNE